ncbi:TonB family protein [Pseudoalteromonas sp. BDTF-M6]|uniref:TonB family protein n=1 Tax=Pseudoalteromonas sp. BDTF-M6 TaxID=2796132 RepID=UPI001BAF01FC|nr:TonB family protein [Pseudoalteromonas sp. BDTF-M6]MBS3796952.1 TonB family protein [Pseudoalteromonas sp. BDTF-M6]
MRKLFVLVAFSFFVFGCATKNSKVEQTSYECAGLEACANNIMKRVRENSQWICDKKSNDKLVVVASKLSKSGDIIEVKIQSTSGDKEFDLAAIQAVQNSAPFFELTSLNPKEFKKASSINFSFVGNKN